MALTSPARDNVSTVFASAGNVRVGAPFSVDGIAVFVFPRLKIISGALWYRYLASCATLLARYSNQEGMRGLDGPAIRPAQATSNVFLGAKCAIPLRPRAQCWTVRRLSGRRLILGLSFPRNDAIPALALKHNNMSAAGDCGNDENGYSTVCPWNVRGCDFRASQNQWWPAQWECL